MYSYFGDAGLVLENGAWHKTFAPSELKQMIGFGVVLPGKKRRFFVAGDIPEGITKISGKLNYTPKTAK
jgi:fimbrial chaperone protein